jgi:hypothetical protein
MGDARTAENAPQHKLNAPLTRPPLNFARFAGKLRKGSATEARNFLRGMLDFQAGSLLVLCNNKLRDWRRP